MDYSVYYSAYVKIITLTSSCDELWNNSETRLQEFYFTKEVLIITASKFKGDFLEASRTSKTLMGLQYIFKVERLSMNECFVRCTRRTDVKVNKQHYIQQRCQPDHETLDHFS